MEPLKRKYTYQDVLIRPYDVMPVSTPTSRSDADLHETHMFHSGSSWRGVPIMAANMDGVGTFSVAHELSKRSMLTAITKFVPESEWKEQIRNGLNLGYVALSVGVGQEDLEFAEHMLETYPIKWLCVDVANGYSHHFLWAISELRRVSSAVRIVAGNVVTPNMAVRVAQAGADVVKIGIGPGSACLTRRQTGVGYPQISAIRECAEPVHQLGKMIMADGGCTCPGDIAKAYVAGADYVMLGGMFAGHDESELPVHSDSQGRKYVQFYGMSSDTAMEKHHGGVADYRSSEGATIDLPYRGPIANTLRSIEGGLRSAITLCSGYSLEDLRSNGQLVVSSVQHNTIYGRYHT